MPLPSKGKNKAYQPPKPAHTLACCLVLAATLTASAEPVLDREAQRAEFRQAWAAAARGQHDAVAAAMERLEGYALTPYLEFEFKRQRAGQVGEAEMERFLARYRDWSFAPTLELQWLRALGRNRDDEVLLRHGRGSTDTRVRCFVARARIRQGETGPDLVEDIRRLWLNPTSQPEECDPAFAWWRRQGNPRPEDAWRRFSLAVNAGESGLARYLVRYLDASDRIWAERWLTLQRQPRRGLSEAGRWRDDPRAREMVRQALERMAASDWKRAGEFWERFAGRFAWDEDEAGAIARRIALFRAVALDAGAVEAIDALPARFRDQQMLEWRVRAGLAHGDWDAVLSSIQAMSAEEQLRPRWRYWRARALAEKGRMEAGLAYAALAGEPNYYGFLAAARLGQPKTLCATELSADGAIQRRLLRDAEFDRALELYEVGLTQHARQTWVRATRRLSRAELEQAALLAAGRGWQDRAVFALGNAGAMNAYPWRFPVVERSRVEAAAGRFGVDPALVYGLMRAESAMQSDALSPAGARGLLQLMPGTAEAVARRNGLAYNGRADLMDPAVNIPLGVAHLAELQRRFDGDWTRVAAAYNAGINAAERWLEERPHPEPDIWLETLPFFETRDYVPRVLAFATIYEWRLGRTPRVLAANLLAEPADSDFVCPDDQALTAR